MHIYKKENNDRNIYIAADLNFCNSKERDDKIIGNWNNLINDNDYVVLLGDIIDKEKYDYDRIKQIFNLLRGKKEIIGIQGESESGREWMKTFGIKCFKVPAAIKGKIDNEEQVIIIYSYPTLVLKNKEYRGTKKYCVAPRSITNQKSFFEDNVLSISIDDWGLSPILYENIPSMIDDILVFEKMENKEEKVDE